MSKHAQRFPPLSITTMIHLKSTSALILYRDLTQVTHIKLSLFSTQQQRTRVSYRLICFLLISSLSQHAPLSIYPSVTRFKLVVVPVTKFLAPLYNCC
ncbi:unnamed protein product [Hymenolepis diminuta]|uniref:Uncharacterized protein n=1 Tax=Hymenolepis diminuta TaxID=6216 RepID=A0A564Z9V7_HYMDI|nr:unnamed protein product [Hymenolepis diminuta]